MKHEYNKIILKTKNKTIEVLPNNLPDFVNKYLDIFYEKGWTIENDELWCKVAVYFGKVAKAEVVKIMGEAEWGYDIIYDNE